MDQEYCPYCMNPVEKDSPCPACGLTAGAYAPSPHHLPPGTVLRERYLVGRVLGEGGFGITYIGCDLRLELKVAIKEYFPTDRANRVAAASLEVSSYSGVAGERYESGRSRFLQEARTMARMDKQPVIVSVRDFFELHNTAYIVMEYVEGTTFKDLVAQRGGHIPAGELLHIIEPLFSALEAMHRKGLIHRDISPENLMLENGDVRLLDFGCARESAGGEATMTIALKHGYAPVEQYQNKGQGSWTDVYALSATIYYCLTGRKPPQSMDRLVEDELVPPRKLGVDLTQRQEQALLYGMGVRPRRRFQSVEELHAALYEGILPKGLELPELSAAGGREPEPVSATEPEPMAAEEPETVGDTQTQTQTQTTQDQPDSAPAWLAWLKARWPIAAGAGAAVVLLIVLLVWRPWAGGASTVDGGPDPTQTVEPTGTVESASPTQAAASTMTVTTETTLLTMLEDDSVGTVIIPSETWFEVTEPVTLTKTLHIQEGAGVSFDKGLTVVDGGRVQIWGNVDSCALLHTMGGGTISVESGGGMGTHMLWLEHAADLTCANDGNVDIFGGNNPTRDDMDPWAQTHYLVLDEDELFANAVHVASEEEFAQHFEGDTPIVVDNDITFTKPYWVRVPVLIPEGVTVDAPCPDPGRDEDNCTLEMCEGTLLVNHGTLKGRLALHCGQGGDQGWTNPSYFINSGAVDANLWTELAAIINLGDMTAREIMSSTALVNLGTMKLDGLLEMQGNWSGNAGTITVARDGDLAIYGGTGWNCFGEVAVEDGGRFCNYAGFYLRSGGLSVAPGGELTNEGLLELNAPLSVQAGAALENNGVVLYRDERFLKLEDGAARGSGRILDGGDSGARTRYVTSESELRGALVDDSCDLVIWYGHEDRSKINLNGGDLVVTKGLVLEGNDQHPVDLNAGGITVTGENAYLIGNTIDFHGGSLMVTESGAAILDNTSQNLGRIDCSNGGLALAVGYVPMGDGGINLSDGGRLIQLNGLQLDGGSLYIDGGGELLIFGSLELLHSNVENNGLFRSYFNNLYQEGGSFANNGRTEIIGWNYYANLSGNVSNHGDLIIGGIQAVHGTLINETDGAITLEWENCPLQVFGRLENKGSIQAAKGAYVETVEGGIFTGSQVEPRE